MNRDSEKMSKRQARREKMRREEMRARLLTILLVVIGASLLAFVFIYPQIKPVGDITIPDPVSRPAGEGLALGDPSAPARIDVFEDFQCPTCREFTKNIEPLVLSQLVETGKAYYVFRQYPFLDQKTSTKESHQAANASMCASEQGKFWEYHDTLFANWNGENQGAFSDRRLTAFAEALELDMTTFQECFDTNRYQKEIEADFTDGLQIGVNGTPSVFVNGQILNAGYVPSFEEIQAAVLAAQPKP